MKLTYKINLVALGVLALVGAAITITGVNTIRQVTYSLNRQLMSSEVDTIYSTFENSYGVLVENQLDSVESYTLQAQSEVLSELANYRYGVTGNLFIVTDQGLVVKHDTLSQGQHIDINDIAGIVAGGNGEMNLPYRGKKCVFSYKYFPQWNWLIMLSVTSEEMFAAQKQFVSRVIVILLISLVLGSLFFVILIKRIVGPILQLAEATTFVSEGRWDTPLPQPLGSDEVAQLTSSFHHMAEKLAEMYGDLEGNLEKIEKSQVALRESEEKLRRAQEFVTAILNNVADPIFVKDEQHRWVQFNEAFCDFMGHSREKMLRKSDYDFVPKEEADGFWEKDDLVFSSGESIENEESLTLASGKKHIILTKKAVFTSAEGSKLIVGTIKDITRRKKMEQELLKSQKFESISILAGGIAHDYNNILTAILGNLSLLKELVDRESNIYYRLAETERASLQAKELTHQLLTFSQGGAPVKTTLSLAKIIEDSITFSLRGTKVRCDLSIEEDIWPVEVDEGQVSRAIHNIVVNAAQAMPKGGVLTVTTTNIGTEGIATLPLLPGRYIRVTIQDNGGGIPGELLPNIFDPYFTTKDDGSGLGLAIAYSVIQRHDGHIMVESEIGVGTTCNLYLPASDKEIVRSKEEENIVLSGSGDILVMDDEAIIRETVTAMLEHLGYNVDSAAGGEEAINMYRLRLEKKNPYDVVIMDLTIPGGIGGQEAIKILLEIDPHAKALVSSGYSHDPVMANFKQYGFSGVIAKPFQLKKIAVLLEEVLAKTNTHEG